AVFTVDVADHFIGDERHRHFAFSQAFFFRCVLQYFLHKIQFLLVQAFRLVHKIDCNHSSSSCQLVSFGYSMREWKMPFRVSHITAFPVFSSFTVLSHPSNCPSFSLSSTIAFTNFFIFSDVGSFIDRPAASILSEMQIMAISLVCGLGPRKGKNASSRPG